MKPKYVPLFFFFIWGVSLFAQNNLPNMAIIPLNPINMAKSEAQTITGLLETSLVKTHSYNIIEQGQMHELVEVQELSLLDCTDEKCAIKVGQLLSAEQILIGSLSQLSNKFIINVKIIDVATGKNLNAEKIDANSLNELIDKIDLLAFALAGLIYQKGENMKLGEALTDVFIETVPAGAEIMINNVKRGKSPDFFQQIPIGKVNVKANKDNLYYEEQLDISPTTKRLTLNLKELCGNIFIKSSVDEVQVVINGKQRGALGPGYFEKITPGETVIELKGNWIYWTGKVEVLPNQTVKIDVEPRAFGEFVYDLPDETIAEIKGVGFSTAIHGKGSLTPFFTGEYIIKVTGNIYNEFKTKIKMNKQETLVFKPELAFSQEHVHALLKAKFIDLVKGLDALTSAQQKIDELLKFKQEISSSPYQFTELLGTIDNLIDDYNLQQINLGKQLKKGVAGNSEKRNCIS